MAKKPKRAQPRNVITLDTSKKSTYSQSRWEQEVCNFVKKLNDKEYKLISEFVDIITRRPRKNATPCKVFNIAKENHA